MELTVETRPDQTLSVHEKESGTAGESSVIRAPARVARAEGALVASRRPALRQVRVAALDDGVCLTGSVASYFEKQQAQEIVMRAGVTVAENRIAASSSVGILPR